MSRPRGWRSTEGRGQRATGAIGIAAAEGAPRKGRRTALLLALLLLAPVAAAPAQAAPLPAAVTGVDLSIPASGIAFSSGYVTAGELLGVDTTVVNGGDTPGNATLQLFAGDPMSTAPFASLPFTVGASSNAVVAATLNTSGLAGIRWVTARLVALQPAENGTAADNQASARLRVHTLSDQRWQGSSAAVIDTAYPQTGFVTVEGNATLTVAPGGKLSIEQARPDEFDILVAQNGQLRIDGGAVASNYPLTVELTDNATLRVENGGRLELSVRSTSAGALTVVGGTLESTALEVDGGTLLLDGATVTAGTATLRASSVTCANSTLGATATISLDAGTTASLVGCALTVESHFPNAAAAEAAFPGIAGSVSAGAGPFQAAVALAGASTASFHGTSASSTVWVGGLAVASTIPVWASGGADATVYRTARVAVTDPIGAPVPDASVQVWDYFDAGVVASALAPNGTVLIELPSDILSGGRSNFVGHYHLRASKASTTAPAAPLIFPLFPDMSPASLVTEVPIALALFAPWGLYPEDVPARVVTTPETVSGESVLSSSMEVREPLTLDHANLTLVQSRPFERYIVVTGNGSLTAMQSQVHSDFPFNLYVMNGTSASLDGSAIVGGNLLLSGAGNLTLTSSRVVGSVIGDAAGVTCQGSFVWGRLLDLDAPQVAASDCVLAGTDLVALAGASLSLDAVGLTSTFEPFDARNRTAIAFAEFDALAGSDQVGAAASPAVRLSAAAVHASGLTIWTCGPVALTLGGGDSSVDAARALACAVSVALGGGNLTMTQAVVDPDATVAYSGTGAVALRGVSSPAPAIAATVRLEIYESVTATVTDDVGLPVEAAQVTAVPQRPGPPTEAAATGTDGAARLFLLASVTENGLTSRGPAYRVNATRAGAASGTVSWEASQAPEIAFMLPATFASVAADANFVLVVALPSGAWRVVESTLPDASVRGFLGSIAPSVPALNFTAAVFPGQNATLFVAADYLYTQGAESTSRPMAFENASFAFAGFPPVGFELDADGAATVQLPLPGNPGAQGANLTIAGSKLQAPARYPGTVVLTPLSQLVVEASLNKRTLKPSESLIVIGNVRDKDGNPVAGATITLTYAPGQAQRTNLTAFDGSFLIKLVAPSATGSFAVSIKASRENAVDSAPAVFPYTVSTGVGTPANQSISGGPNLVALLLGGVVFVGSAAGLVYAYTQRRVARGEFVVCGKCGKPTLANDKKCRSCGVEFEATVAKCSKCGAWIAPDSAQCPQCHTQFVTDVVRDDRPTGPEVPTPDAGLPAGFDLPEGVSLTGRRLGPSRLEDMEFRMPGTTDTLDLGEKGAAEIFGPASAPAQPPAPRTPATPSPGVSSAGRALERMELPRVQDIDSPVREVSAMEGGAPTTKEPVTLGSANLDLSRTTAAATATKPDARRDDDIPEDVLRELLMKAAPELTGEMLPGDIRKELAEIARSEAPAAAERKAATPPKAERPAPMAPPDERPAEAPEKSRKTAFDVFSTPAKNIPAGFERKQAPAPKDAAGKSAPVCPNCGGNWVVQRDGKNSCRVCGTRW